MQFGPRVRPPTPDSEEGKELVRQVEEELKNTSTDDINDIIRDGLFGQRKKKRKG
jgi:hypothetical protein